MLKLFLEVRLEQKIENSIKTSLASTLVGRTCLETLLVLCFTKIDGEGPNFALAVLDRDSPLWIWS